MTLLFAFPAWAAKAPEDLKSEIIYRAGLGRADDVRLLLEQGASPDQVNEAGVPVLALAAARRDEEALSVVKALLDAGAAIDARDGEGQTPLFHAARQGNRDIVLTLMEQGAGYYLTDHGGDIARTIAFRAGHKDIVEAMDQFVKNQDAKIRKQYEEYNKAVAERLDQEEKLRREEVAARDRLLEEQSREAAANPEETVAPPQAVVVTDTQALKEAARELAFEACAFQYWSFCRDTAQTTELTPAELAQAISSGRERILELRQAVDMHHGKPGYGDRVIEQSKKHIFNRLRAMPSKTYRFEHGVGKMHDMNERCGAVSLIWEQPPPGKAKPSSPGGKRAGKR